MENVSVDSLVDELNLLSLGETENLVKAKGYYDLIINKTILESPDMVYLVKDWPNYDDLRIIVIGSSPAPDFISSGAFVGQAYSHNQSHIPTAILNLHKLLYEANYNYTDLDLDLHGHHSKFDHGILFVNVSLFVHYQDYKPETGHWGNDRYVPCVIEFINEVLKQKKRDEMQIGVIDMRLDQHCYVHFENGEIDETKSEKSYYKWKEIRKPDLAYKLKNYKNKHNLIRMCHPTYVFKVEENEDEARKLLDKFKAMHPEILSLYKKAESCEICHPI